MRRNKRLSIKKEKEDAKTRASANKEQDLAYYVHDRVELMRQVFSTLSAKEIKAMAPECIRKLSNDDIEELCLDENILVTCRDTEVAHASTLCNSGR
ncbi:unnamed protein product [Plutella xylostella]|uniref:(diamondback moth) hypothetical protein n=1 Tax=Plutella xylostella TaxID=51655 RepID=A0A8S4EXH5_PLUXY|nr:unnamed protein product [Plutella xylostella]